MKHILYILLLFVAVPVYSQTTPFFGDSTGLGYLLSPVRVSGMDTLYFDLDTLEVKSATGMFHRWLDSALATVSSVDTSKLVSMDRDDASIRGEKTFRGVTGFNHFGQFTLSNADRRAWWVSHDTATKRLGDTVLTVSSVGLGQQTMQLYSSGILDLPKQSSVRAFVNSNVSHAAFLDTVVFNAETYDTQDEFDVATGEFIARQGGTYLVSVQVADELATSSGSVEARIRKNYSNYSVSGSSPLVNSVNGFTYVTYTDMVQLDAQGSIKIQIVASDSGTIQGDSNGQLTWITILKVM